MRVRTWVVVGAVGLLLASVAGLIAYAVAGPEGDEAEVDLEVTAELLETDPYEALRVGGGDCGWSAPLHDGRVLWVTCDAGRYSNVVGLAPRQAPAQPEFFEQLYVPLDPDLDCPEGRDDRLVWTTALAARPGPQSTTVAILLVSGCRTDLVDGPPDDTTGGIAVLEYRSSMAGGPLEPDVVAYDLWPGVWPDGTVNVTHTSGAVFFEEHLYAYACGADFGVFDQSGPDAGRCTIARAPVDGPLAERASWAYWHGGGRWEPPACAPGSCRDDDVRAAEEDQAPIDLPVPGSQKPAFGGGEAFVPELFPVRVDERLDLLVGTSQQTLGDAADDLWLRVARRPEGPWSLPAEVELPCPGDPDEADSELDCRHHTPHPELSSSGELVVTFFDSSNRPSTLRFATLGVCVTGVGHPRPCPE